MYKRIRINVKLLPFLQLLEAYLSMILHASKGSKILRFLNYYNWASHNSYTASLGPFRQYLCMNKIIKSASMIIWTGESGVAIYGICMDAYTYICFES